MKAEEASHCTAMKSRMPQHELSMQPNSESYCHENRKYMLEKPEKKRSQKKEGGGGKKKHKATEAKPQPGENESCGHESARYARCSRFRALVHTRYATPRAHTTCYRAYYFYRYACFASHLCQPSWHVKASQPENIRGQL
jgi:hypothetical protein